MCLVFFVVLYYIPIDDEIVVFRFFIKDPEDIFYTYITIIPQMHFIKIRNENKKCSFGSINTMRMMMMMVSVWVVYPAYI